jgi:hypothetical protein
LTNNAEAAYQIWAFYAPEVRRRADITNDPKNGGGARRAAAHWSP